MKDNKEKEEQNMLSPEILKELVVFEKFFKRIGFKRIEGAIFGLLVLSENSLSSEEIEKTLSLSQSATSMALKNLQHYNAIESIDCRERRMKLHFAKEDSMAIVSTIFRKREQEYIEELKQMATRVLARSSEEKVKPQKRIGRLKSLVFTCEIAENIMNFVMNAHQLQLKGQYAKISKKLPALLNGLLNGTDHVTTITSTWKNTISDKLKDGIFKITGDH